MRQKVEVKRYLTADRKPIGWTCDEPPFSKERQIFRGFGELDLWWLSRPQASTLTLMVTGTMDINSDPGWRRALDPIMTPGSSLNQMSSCLTVAAQSTQISTVPILAMQSDTRMTTVCETDFRPPHGLWGNVGHRHQQRPQLQQDLGPRHSLRQHGSDGKGYREERMRM